MTDEEYYSESLDKMISSKCMGCKYNGITEKCPQEKPICSKETNFYKFERRDNK